MRIANLQIYLSVIESGSLSNAARLEHLTQPAISNIIRSLEAELDVTLLTRNPGKHSNVEPTHAGRVFAAYAHKTVHEYQNICLELKRLEDEPLLLHLVASPTIGSSVLPILINRFRLAYNQVRITSSTVIGYPDECQTDLSGIEYDIGLAPVRPHSDEFHSEAFFRDPILLIAPVSMKLNDKITLKELKHLPFISRPRDGKNMRRVARELAKSHVSLDDLNTIMYVNGDADVLQSVIRGSGVGFVTRSVYDASLNKNSVTPIQVSKLEFGRNLYLTRKKNATLSVVARLFWEFAQSTSWRDAFHYDTIPK